MSDHIMIICKCKSLIRSILILIVLVLDVGAIEPSREGPRSPSDELAALVLADPELMLELVAAEPDVKSPVAIAWDEDGRLYVAEMTDYPVAPASGRIRRLEDRDGDGRYERATIFADQLPFPNGVLPCFGGVLVTAAPHIWFFRDRDGDGRAEEKRIVLTGFGEGNTQLRVNGPTIGLDNMVYVANGRSDGDIRVPDDVSARAVSIRRRDLRFRLTGKRSGPVASMLEAVAGFSQFGLPHDDWGNRFPSWNTIPIRHVVFEQQALDRNPYLAETSCVASILDLADGGRLHGISPAQARFNRESVAFFNASCGPTIERGGLLPAAYRGNAFVCEPLSNLVHRRVLEPDKATFVARRVEKGKEFLASSDPAFRPVNLTTGPDGALYVVDMYRELVEHPQFVPEAARDATDFRRWYDRGRIWRIRPRSHGGGSRRNLNLSRAETRELVELLGHPNGWWRSTAQRLLDERQDQGAVPLLIAALHDQSNPLATVHALWTLAALNGLNAGLLNELVDRRDPALREHALRVAATLEARAANQPIATAKLNKLAEDSSARVRLHAAIALGERCVAEPGALDALAKIAVKDADDPFIRLAILSGLREKRLAFIPLCDRIPSGSGRDQLLAQAAAIVGVRRRPAELSALLGQVASSVGHGSAGPGADISIDALTLLSGLAEGLERSGPPLHAIGQTASPEVKSQWEKLAAIWPAASALAVSNQPVPERLVAFEVLSRGRPDLVAAIVAPLFAPAQPREIQAAATRAVVRTGDPALAAKVLEGWSDLAVATRRDLLSAMASSRVLAGPLIDCLEQGRIRPSELDAASWEALGRLADPPSKQRASTLLARFAPAPRSDVIARYRPALGLAGDDGRGAAVFAKNCQTCHERQGQGHRVGPDLSGVAGRAPEALLTDILDPNREVAPDYVALTLATRQGIVTSGLLADETGTTIKLRRAEGIEETILRSEIDELRSTGRSLMPEGLEQTINPQEMADLIAFLRQGK